MEKLHYEYLSSEADHALVFLHGHTSSMTVFDPIFNDPLPCDMWRFDLPGHGQSRHLPNEEAYHYKNLMAMARAFIMEHVQKPFFLVGNSLGGHMAIELLPQLEHCLGTIIFGASPVAKPLNAAEAFHPTEAGAYLLEENPSDDLVAKCLDMVTSNEIVKDHLRDAFMQSDSNFRPAFVKSFFVEQTYDNEKAIVESTDKAVYCIHGLKDVSVNLTYLKSLRNIREIYELENCGHYPSLEQPEQFRKILQEILNIAL